MRFKLIITLFFICTLLVFPDEFLSVRYVIAKPALNIRSSPSISSNLLGPALLYGLRIVAHERSDNMDTVNGITDYWYRCSGGYIGIGAKKLGIIMLTKIKIIY